MANRDNRYLKKLNKTAVPLELFRLAVDAIFEMPDADRQYLEYRIAHITHALGETGIDYLPQGELFPAIVFRIDALNNTLCRLDKRERIALDNSDGAMDQRILAAAISEPLVPPTQNVSDCLTFDLNSFRGALGLRPSP